ncbi:MAG: winged helix-turn-helix transcriptional regulator [bacterium]|nr:winged helix-turn-helix transcriptional regulator [bacterium]
MDDELYRLHAEVCKVLAHPRRLQIINELRDGEMVFGEIVSAIGVDKPNVSQHLSQMRQRGIVEQRREGAEVYYRIANPKIIEACDLMREILLEQLEKHGEIADRISSETRK